MLVILRVALGWHFLYSGMWKLANPDFSSEGFLSQAKGPLAERFQALVPDQDGRERLFPDFDPVQQKEPTAAGWRAWHDRLDQLLADFKARHADDMELMALAESMTQSYRQRLDEYREENAEAIGAWRHNLDRYAQARNSPSSSMPYEQERQWRNKTALAAQARAWIAGLENIVADCRSSLSRLSADAAGGRQSSGDVFSDPAPLDYGLSSRDRLITWSNMAIGVCLIAGLFTRLAAIGGGLFLLLVVLAQPDWPGLYPPPHPSAGRSLFINKEAIEMLALFTLAATPVGRWGGLDFLIHHLLVRPVFRRREF